MDRGPLAGINRGTTQASSRQTLNAAQAETAFHRSPLHYRILLTWRTKFFHRQLDAKDCDFERPRTFRFTSVLFGKAFAAWWSDAFLCNGRCPKRLRARARQSVNLRFHCSNRTEHSDNRDRVLPGTSILFLENAGLYFQDDQTQFFVPVFNLKSVLDASYLRNHSQIPELTCQISSHVIVPSFFPRLKVL
jgi:hypothetical protein